MPNGMAAFEPIILKAEATFAFAITVQNIGFFNF
jgi:hypothetical protein